MNYAVVLNNWGLLNKLKTLLQQGIRVQFVE